MANFNSPTTAVIMSIASTPPRCVVIDQFQIKFYRVVKNNSRHRKSNERHSSETVVRVSPEINKSNTNKKQYDNNSNNNSNHTRRSLRARLNVHASDIPKLFEIHMIQRLRKEVRNVTLSRAIQRVDKTLCDELP